MVTRPLSASDITEPTSRGSGDWTVLQWLDALADGACTRDQLIRGVAPTIQRNRDAGWELLSMIDQYFRRRRIGADDFRELQQQLQALVLAAPATPDERSPIPDPVAPDATAGCGPRTLAAGERLRGRYRIQGVLGRGGMGMVYAALDEFRQSRHPEDQHIALKVLHTQVAERADLLAELRDEFQCLQSLSHPNIIRVHEFDQDSGLSFFTMERLRGATLDQLISEHTALPSDRHYALSILEQIGAAVAYAQSRGVVHGDLNPANILVTDAAEVRVLDFGAAYRRGALHPPPAGEAARTSVATPGFASCEVLEGLEPTPADDVYALSCIAYVLLSGEHPFKSRNALAARKAAESVRRPPDLSLQQWNTLKNGLSFDRTRRPINADVWLQEFTAPSDSYTPPPPRDDTRPPRGRMIFGRLVTAVLVLAVLVGGFYILNRFVMVNTSSPPPQAAVTAPPAAIASSAPAAVAATPVPAPAPTAAAPEPQPVAAPSVPPSAQSPSQSQSQSQSTTVARSGASQPPPSPSRSQLAAVIRDANAAPAAFDARAPRAASAAASADTRDPRIELASSTVEVAPSQPVARIAVTRAHGNAKDVTFMWSTEAGTAKAGQDFAAVKSRVENFPAGQTRMYLMVPIVSDPRRQSSRTFYVVINGATEGATLGDRTLTQVTIPPGQ